MIRRVIWYGTVEEFPMNMWEVEVTDWLIGKIILLRKIFYKTCHGMDARSAKPYIRWSIESHSVEEKGTYDCPKKCLWISDKEEKVL